MKKLLSILLTTAILFANEGSNYFVDNFLKYSTLSFNNSLFTLSILDSYSKALMPTSIKYCSKVIPFTFNNTVYIPFSNLKRCIH